MYFCLIQAARGIRRELVLFRKYYTGEEPKVVFWAST